MMSQKEGWWGRLIVVLVVTGIAAFTLAALAYEGGALHFSHRYMIKAILPTSSNLVPGATVTMAGAPVGSVTSVKQVGNGAEVTLAISDRAVTPIPANTRIQLAETTAVGENYVEVMPGNARQKLTSGATLPMSRANQYVDVDQLLDVLKGNTTQRTREVIDALGEAVNTNGRGQDLNDTLAGVHQTVVPVAQVVTLLKGQKTQAATLVRDLGDVASAAGSRGQEIESLANSALGTFRAVGSEDTSVSQLLDDLPGTLNVVKRAANALNSATNTATPVVTHLASTIRDLKPAIQSLAPAATEGRSVLANLNQTAPGLRTTLTDVRSLSNPVSAALPQLKQAVCQLNPVLKYAEPYTDDVISFFSWFGSATNAYDNISHLVSLVPIVGDDSVVGLPANVSTGLQTLLHAGLLENTTSLTEDPYPAPGLIGKEAAGENGYPDISTVSGMKAAGYTYPHITENCDA
jgi:phospholipid/cholesterol/gamma-HCH transport system substrate-binding protein